MASNKLTKIQNELKVPKSRFNEFSKFYYRNCEDILDAVKPLLAKYNCTLTIKDSIEEHGSRIYVKALACLTDNDDEKFEACSTAYAREAETKKGMDDSQITGSASSYARKYALAGLFLIDDGNDADAQDNTTTPKKESQSRPASKSKYQIDFEKIREHCEMIDDTESLLEYFNEVTAGNPTEKQMAAIKKIFSERKGKL